MAQLPPFEVEIHELAARGIAVGVAPDGRRVEVAQVPVGGRVLVQPGKRRKGTWSARRLAVVRPPVAWATPACPQFATCGGCALQEMALDGQRAAKAELVRREVGPGPEVAVHPIRGDGAAYGYRNKFELSFGTRRWLSEAEKDGPIAGAWLGFHAPGRFDRVVDAPTCSLMGPSAARALRIVREIALEPGAPPCWDAREHTGFWRHLGLRESRTGELLVSLYTAPGAEAEAAWIARIAAALDAGDACSVLWFENPGVADVARGALRQQWGPGFLEERLGSRRFRLGPTSFFQTNTAGAEVLYDVIGEAVGAGGTLFDLYSGIGSIGLYLADRFDRIVGVEEVAAAVEDAAANAERNGIEASWTAGRMEDLLSVLVDDPAAAVVVDPPRAGLHPKVAARLAAVRARVLVYVACHPASLGRDKAILEAGGWRMTDLWAVDLFPQTGHVEAVARFVREGAPT